jgi:hypothetical protein
VADYTSELGNETLQFIKSPTKCDKVFEINGPQLVLKENLSDPNFCVSFRPMIYI